MGPVTLLQKGEQRILEENRRGAKKNCHDRAARGTKSQTKKLAVMRVNLFKGKGLPNGER